MDEDELFRLQLEEITRMEEEDQRMRNRHNHQQPRQVARHHRFDEGAGEDYDVVVNALRDEQFEEAIKASQLMMPKSGPKFNRLHKLKSMPHETCSICQDTLDENICEIKHGKSSHYFHCDCLQEFIDHNIDYKCPNCFQPFDEYNNFGIKLIHRRRSKKKK